MANDSPGINANMGFIGYGDIEEEVIGYALDIEFTKSPIELKSKITFKNDTQKYIIIYTH